ncbi:MAG: cupin domain-containing protein [Rhizobiales bacterium]|nr:cupin domain-containing protein [Hyphomicrobiales bacterium]
MTIQHHPSDETIARHAAGQLEPAAAIVLAVHLSGCPVCRERMRQFEALGGALLEDLAPAPMAEDAFTATLARIDAEERPGTRWMAPGFRMSRIRIPGEPGANLILMRIGANRRMPEHGHTGRELTQVLHGSYSDANGRYGAGDLAEEDAEGEHQPLVDPGSECICLAAIEGRMRLSGVARLLQPFIGI